MAFMKQLLLCIAFALVFLAACSRNYTTYTVAELDRSNPIPISSEFVTVAYDRGVTLQYRADYAWIRVIDAQGNIWESTPADLDDDDLARGQVRMALSSMLTATFLSALGNESFETSMAASVRTGDATAYLIPGGVRVEFYFPAQRTMIPVEVVLENGTMLASVNPAHIHRVRPGLYADEQEWEVYNRNHRLTDIGLLPHFMHAGVNSQGYILVPDGSGALIYLNNGRSRTTFSQSVYGVDRVNPPRHYTGGAQRILMPVFGMQRDNAAAFAIIEGGAALATINASVSGGNSSYNSASASFVLRPRGTYSVTNAQGVVREIMVTTDWFVDIDAVAVRYFFLEDGAGYSEMAYVYRQHLIAQGMTPAPAREGLPLVLDVYGSVTRRMSVLGVPRNRNIPLTTFEAGGEMVDTLLAGGIDSLVVRYNNWLPRGNYSTAPSRFTPNRSLGGSREFNNFANSLSARGVDLYLDVDFVTAYSRPFLGVVGAPVTRNISNMPAQQTAFDLSVFTPVDEPIPSWWLYSPHNFLGTVGRFTNRASSENITGLSLATLSNTLYGDIGRNSMDRGAAEINATLVANEARENMGRIMGDGAAAFWLPHTSTVVNSPIGCSRFGITDTSVPFYQMVLRGYVDFSLPAYNLANDREGMVLRAAETGAMLQLSVIADNPALLVETPLEWLVSPSFDYWYSEVLLAVHRLAPVYQATAGSSIANHSFLAEGVTRTVFTNGAVVTVNYNFEPHVANGVTIPARDFIVTGGAQ